MKLNDINYTVCHDVYWQINELFNSGYFYYLVV